MGLRAFTKKFSQGFFKKSRLKQKMKNTLNPGNMTPTGQCKGRNNGDLVKS